MYSIKIYQLIIAFWIVSSTTAMGSSLEKSMLIKNQINNFSTTKKNKDMISEWELHGDRMIKYVNNITLIKQPQIKIYNTDTTINIKSDSAIDPSGEMEEIYLKNNVLIKEKYLYDVQPMKIYTSYAIYYVSKNLIETDREVTIITADSVTTGLGLSANINTGITKILSNVKRIVKENNESRTIMGNQMIYNSNNSKWIVKDTPANDLKTTITKKVITTFDIK
jgi:LPS export ABC transporter protein LptC